MDIRKLQRAIVDGLEDVKGQDIVVFNTEHLSALFERVVIASGTSNRQTKALAASVRDAVKAKGFGPTRTEGEENGEWIIVDCGAAVVHLMQPSIREYYHLEEIWGDKPVHLKLASAAPRLVKASEPAPAPAVKKAAATKKSTGKKAPAKKALANRTPAKKAAAKTAPKQTPLSPVRKSAPRQPAAGPAPAKRASATKVAARRAPPARKAVTRTVGVKSSAAPSMAPAARKAPVAKGKSPARKTARRTA